MIRFYHASIDVKHFVKKNRYLLIGIGVFLLFFAVLGTISALKSDVVALCEEGKTAILIFVDEGKSAFVGNIFLSTLFVSLLLCLTRFHPWCCKCGIVLVGFKIYFAFKQVFWVLIVYGLKAILPCLVILIVECLVCTVSSTIYLLNVTDDCGGIEPLKDAFLQEAAILTGMALLLNVILVILYTLLRVLV